MKSRRTTTSWLATFSSLLVVGCGDSLTDPAAEELTVSIVPGAVTFSALGASEQLRAEVRDADGRLLSDRSVQWSTLNEDVVLVDETGRVTAVGNGTESVRATVGSHRAAIRATVEQLAVSLELSAERETLVHAGQTVRLEATALDARGNRMEAGGAGRVSFHSSAPGVVAVGSDGTALANWMGRADIVARIGSFADTISLEVLFDGPAGGPVVGTPVPCVGGEAAGFPCDRVDLLSYLPLTALGTIPGPLMIVNDLWGWRDPLTLREYALVGRSDGLTFVDVTNRVDPRAVGHLRSPGSDSPWRDVKTFRNHAYLVGDGSAGHGLVVFDLTRLRGVRDFTHFQADSRYMHFEMAHNIAINEATGFAYVVGAAGSGTTCGGGLHVLDLNPNPRTPAFVGCFADTSTGLSLTGYTHDVQCVLYDGPDTAHVGREICIGSNETALSIADVTDKENPARLSTASYPDAGYVHQGWLTEDHRYFVQNDELDEFFSGMPGTRTLIWDVEDLDDPVLAAEYFGPNLATDHNVYVLDRLAYQSNYSFGLRILDLSAPTAPTEAGYFDTHPPDDVEGTDSGSWSNYPFFGDVVLVTSKREGLFVLRRQ